jgi:hypothetical protein
MNHEAIDDLLRRNSTEAIHQLNELERQIAADQRRKELARKYAGTTAWTEKDLAETARKNDEAHRADGYFYDYDNALYRDYVTHKPIRIPDGFRIGMGSTRLPNDDDKTAYDRRCIAAGFAPVYAECLVGHAIKEVTA